MDVMYAVVMDGGEGPPVGLWRNEETARGVCAKQPPGHKDIVVAVVPASVVDDLTRERDMLSEVVTETARELGCEPGNEAMLERARDLARQNEHRQADLDALVRKHADLARQLAEARALLAETGHPQ